MKKSRFILCLMALMCVFFVTCSFENPIMDKWWQEEENGENEGDAPYPWLVRDIPVVTIETLVEREVVYQTVFVELPPEIIYETKYENKYIYETVYEKLPPEIIYEEVIKYETIYQTVYETIEVEKPVYIDRVEYIYETIYEQLPPNTVYIYETVYETIYETITVEVPTVITEYVKEELTITEMIEIIKTQPDTVIKEVIKELIKEIPIEVVKEIIVEVIKELTATEIVEIIKQIPDENIKEVIKEIIKEIPPENIIEYLTEEQIKYIVKQQPPQMILQSIQILGIEYIIFSGDQTQYNGEAGPNATTNLSGPEKDTNDKNISAMAESLANNSDYFIILHGHANPTKAPTDPGYDQDLQECKAISNERAVNVAVELEKVYKTIPGVSEGIYPSERLTTSGYGGEKNLVSGSTLYAGLNRRVEMILFRVVATTKTGK